MARAKGVWEEEGQGTVTGIGAASWYGVLTSRHTLGLPRSDSSPIRCRGAGQATQTPRSGPLVGENVITCSGSGKVGPEWCMVSGPDMIPLSSFLRGLAIEGLKLLWGLMEGTEQAVSRHQPECPAAGPRALVGRTLGERLGGGSRAPCPPLQFSPAPLHPEG